MVEKGGGLGVCLASAFFGHYAHAGFLLEMEGRGVMPDRISGASAGALAGGMWAAGLRGDALREIMLSRRFRRAFFDWGAPLRAPGVATWSYASGIFSGARLERRLRELVGSRKIEDLCDPKFEIAVANLTRGRGEIRSEGGLVDFLIASLSMPLVFRVKEIAGERFLDGGLSNETPFTHWLTSHELGEIVVHRVVYTDLGLGEGKMSPTRVLAACHSIPNRELEAFRWKAAEASGKEVKLAVTELTHPGTRIGEAKAAEMMAAGAATAQAWLADRQGSNVQR